jgi:hypothetical protein
MNTLSLLRVKNKNSIIRTWEEMVFLQMQEPGSMFTMKLVNEYT